MADEPKVDNKAGGDNFGKSLDGIQNLAPGTDRRSLEGIQDLAPEPAPPQPKPQSPAGGESSEEE